MECPVCGKQMIEEDFGGINVDVCRAGCQGLWFDWFELGKLDENHEGIGPALQQALYQPKSQDERRDRIKCPKCGLVMHQHQYQAARDVKVDECYGCGGFFLDAGELGLIRQGHMSDSEQEQYAQELLAGMPVAKDLILEIDKQQLRCQAIKNFTRFFRLSHYMKTS